MPKTDQYEQLTEQDYGHWIDRATLYNEDGELTLQIEAGYSKPYDQAWYELLEEPAQSLEATFSSWENLGRPNHRPIRRTRGTPRRPSKTRRPEVKKP